MLKLKAVILLIALSVYYLDIIAAVKACELMQQNAGCCEESCSIETETGICAAAEEECPFSGDECPDSSDDDCCKYCITCPQAYVTILPGSPYFTLHFTLVNKIFPVLQDDHVKGFYTTAWKPPNCQPLS